MNSENSSLNRFRSVANFAAGLLVAGGVAIFFRDHPSPQIAPQENVKAPQDVPQDSGFEGSKRTADDAPSAVQVDINDCYSRLSSAISDGNRDRRGEALRHLASGSTSQSLINGLVSKWADLDPEEASRWVEGLQDPDNRQNGRLALVSELAGQSPERAAAYAAPLLSKPGGAELASALVNAWGTQDPKATAQWLDSLAAGKVREQAAGALATVWAASDIAAATHWSETLKDTDMKEQVTDHLATTWGAIEPEKALTWLDTLPQNKARTEATRGALDSWAATDYPGLEKWLSSRPAGPVSDMARMSLGEVQMDRDPASAMQTAQGISDPDERDDTLVKYYRYWRKRDAKAAIAWLQSSGTPEVRERLAMRTARQP